MDGKKDKSKFRLFSGKPPVRQNSRDKLDKSGNYKPPDTPPSTMSPDEVERQFQQMLEEMDLSEAQTKSLRDKPLLVKQNMLSNYATNLNSTKNNNPAYYTNILRNHQNYSAKHLQNSLDELLVRLRSNGLSWIRSFNSNEGLTALLRFLAYALAGYYPGLGLHCLRCIRVFGNCGYGMNALVDHKTATTLIARCMDSDQIPMVDCVIELLSSIALFNEEGYQKVMEGLTYSAELAKAPGDRFVPLLKALDITELARPALQLFNVLVNRGCLVDSLFEADFRITLRLELNQLGIGEKIQKLKQSPDAGIQKHINIYLSKAEEDADALFDRLETAKCDLCDASQVFEILNRTLAGTSSESKFLSILQRLLFVRDEPFRLAYFTLLDELVGQVVLHTDGHDPDPKTTVLQLNVDTIIDAIMGENRSTGTTERETAMQKKLDQALQAKIEAEATIATLEKQLETHGIRSDGKVSVPSDLEEKLSATSKPGNIPPPPLMAGIPPPPPMAGIPPPPPMAGIPPPPPIGGIPPPPPIGGIPPPPPIGGVSRLPPVLVGKLPTLPKLPFGMTEKKKYTPEVPLKKANWDKIAQDKLSEDSVWVKIHEDDIASEELFGSLQAQFRTKPVKKVLTGDESSGGAETGAVSAAGKKTKSMRFLDGKTAQNLSILLGSLKVPYPEMRRRIMTVDETLLSSHILEQLLKSLPEPTVIAQITGLINEKDDLADPEQFLCEIGSIKKLMPRLNAILFKLRFDEKQSELRPDIVDADEALREIRSSDHLRQVLQVVLLLGNYMNSGSRNAQSLGFQISFLAKLDSTKDVTNQHTLLHFIVDYLDKHFPETAKGIVTDLSHLEQACRFSEDAIKASINEMSKALTTIENELRTYKSQDPTDAYLEKMNAFAKIARTQMDQLQTMFERLKERFIGLAKYLAFDPNKYHMENLFTDLKVFYAAYTRATADMAKRRALEERQKRLAEEQERRIRERETKSREQAVVAGGATGEEESNVIDNLMEALKSGAAFSEGTPRRPRSRPAGAASNTRPPVNHANRQRNMARRRSRDYTDLSSPIVDVT